ncbi:winged helix-turn-helix transcriptional regulator [Lysinibacillus fusiformis]|uniref:winged helix-turn-helix transcriptional regulator n=1 Tax=Lysinibacillus fusiformis TaxID=28031 RepID=UPI00148DAB65|nr:helix-turn-helix domain-containing protein [Lysinibacillus fusiformis]NOG29700.1 helix-turn-helix transcriptional regulator [Lysinibacillus fusiformis]
MQKVYNIGVEATLEVIGGKWKPIILCHLNHQGKIRTNEFRRLIPGISQKMLTNQLRELEQAGLIHRKVFNQVPPKVEYSLTSYGHGMEPILNMLCTWGEKHVELLQDKGEDVLLKQRDEDIAMQQTS